MILYDFEGLHLNMIAILCGLGAYFGISRDFADFAMCVYMLCLFFHFILIKVTLLAILLQYSV